MSLVSLMCVKTSDSEWLPEGSYKRRKYRSHHRIERGTVNIRTGLRTVESIFR